MYSYCCLCILIVHLCILIVGLCILIVVYVFLDVATLTGVQFEFDQPGAVTCKFRVGDVTNSWQQCIYSRLAGKRSV